MSETTPLIKGSINTPDQTESGARKKGPSIFLRFRAILWPALLLFICGTIIILMISFRGSFTDKKFLGAACAFLALTIIPFVSSLVQTCFNSVKMSRVHCIIIVAVGVILSCGLITATRENPIQNFQDFCEDRHWKGCTYYHVKSAVVYIELAIIVCTTFLSAFGIVSSRKMVADN